MKKQGRGRFWGGSYLPDNKKSELNGHSSLMKNLFSIIEVFYKYRSISFRGQVFRFYWQG